MLAKSQATGQSEHVVSLNMKTDERPTRDRIGSTEECGKDKWVQPFNGAEQSKKPK